MKILEKGEKIYGKCTAAVGKFDAVHKGHAEIFRKAVSFSDTQSLIYIIQDDSPRLYTDAELLEIISEYSPDYVRFERLSGGLREKNRDEFLTETVNDFGVSRFVVGDDFTFGYMAQGNTDYLKEKSAGLGYEVCIVPYETFEGRKISSGDIKEKLSEGNVADANNMLGRMFSVSGTVTEGNHIGRTINTPTVNIYAGKFLPAFGVYAVYCHAEGKSYCGIANVGIRPTVSPGNTSPNIETHILGFDGNLYGKKIKTEFVDYIRPEKCFSSVYELEKQIKADIDAAEKIFESKKH